MTVWTVVLDRDLDDVEREAFATEAEAWAWLRSQAPDILQLLSSNDALIEALTEDEGWVIYIDEHNLDTDQANPLTPAVAEVREFFEGQAESFLNCGETELGAADFVSDLITELALEYKLDLTQNAVYVRERERDALADQARRARGTMTTYEWES
jgi:hypothetical protein